MKKILITIFACAGMMAFSGCDDFLKEEPKSQLTTVGYYKTKAQAEANVNYLYRKGAASQIASAPSAYLGSFATISGMLTGYFSNSYEGQEVVCKYSRELSRQKYTMQVSGTLDGVWDACYNAINVANSAIKYIPGISMETTSISKLVAEAKFFRAFNYFYLVKTFGAIPFYTEPYETAVNMELERTRADNVYAQIETDLKEAIEILPASLFAANAHRITKYAAAMLLTNVYMQQNKYAEAAKYARVVIGSSHKLVKNDDLAMNSAFNKLRSMDDLDEVIYALEFDNSVNTTDWLPTYSCSSNATAVFGTYSVMERVYGPSDRFLNVYDSKDLRIQPNQFFHWEYINPNTGKKWSSPIAGCWYYFDEEALLSTGKGTKDWNIFRYAEALLAGAESIAQSEGVTSEAVGYLAQVQVRSNMEGKSVEEISAVLKKLSTQAFIEVCWTERLREFPLEYKIWDDCVRTGMFPVISETEKGKVNYVKLLGAQNAAGATFKESDLFWPISVNEMQRNPNLVQNMGYN